MGFARFATRLRMTQVGAITALLLFSLTLLLFYKVFIEDYGPFDGAINYHRMTVVSRSALGYTGLPVFRRIPGLRQEGYFESYVNKIRSRDWYDYCRYDNAYWPNGDPGQGERNPLPPFVQVHEIYAIDPEIPMLLLTAAWGVWIWRFIRHLQQHSPRVKGFEVLVSPPQQH